MHEQVTNSRFGGFLVRHPGASLVSGETPELAPSRLRLLGYTLCLPWRRCTRKS